MDSTDRCAERQVRELKVGRIDLGGKSPLAKALEDIDKLDLKKWKPTDNRAELEWRELAKSYQYLYEQRCSDLDRAIDMQLASAKEVDEWRAKYRRLSEIVGCYLELESIMKWHIWRLTRKGQYLAHTRCEIELDRYLNETREALRREVEDGNV